MPNRPFPKRPRLEHSNYTDAENTFHLVLRAFVDTAPFSDKWGERVCTTLLRERERNSVALVAACLLPDHLHVVACPDARSIPEWVRSFKTYTSKLLEGVGYPGRLWQPGFYDHLVRNEAEYATLIQYVRQNHVEAGLVNAATEWPWLLMPSE
jgi:putative transposase